jgi:lambda family phage minor tail protein L
VSVPLTQIQSLSPTAVVELFVLDATACGGTVYRFHAGTNALGTSVVWQGQTFSPFPIQAEGFEWSSKGTLPRPKLRVAAMDGLVGGLVRDLEDLVGASVILKRTFAKYLDAVNFTGGVNATADPTACWHDEPWVIERKTLESAEVIEFELVSPMDVQNAMIPKRRITANICPWAYKGTECGYAGALGTCAKTLADCRTHFGAAADLPFGAFPGTARVR